MFSSTSAHGTWVITTTLIVSLCLSVMPLPFWAQWGRPEFMALVLIYWIIALPERLGLGSAWIAGFLLDIVEGAPLGQNALAMGILAYLCQLLYKRVRMYTPWQQAGVVFVLIGLEQLICNWIQAITGTPVPDLQFLLPALSSAILWPVVLVVLRAVRRRYVYS